MAVAPLISRETWELAQARRVERAHLGRREVKHDCLLRHRVRCGQCGGKGRVDPKAVGNGQKRIYYRCAAAHNHKYHNYPRPCSASPFRVDAVDSLVWEWVKSLLIAPEMLQHGRTTLLEEQNRAAAPLQARIAAIEKELAGKRQELERLLDAYLVGHLTQEELVARRDKLGGALSALARERSALEQRVETSALAPEQLADLRQFAAQVADGLAGSNDDFAFRRFVIETLDVSVGLVVDEGQKTVMARCVLGEQRLPLASVVAKRGNQRNTGPGGAALDRDREDRGQA